MRENINDILENIGKGNYSKAYCLGLSQLCKSVDGREKVVVALREFSARLRSECMDRAIQKDDYGKDYCDLENLLRKVNELTGEDMCGNIQK